MRRFLRHNGLTLSFGFLFLAALAGQAVAGWMYFNDQQIGSGLATIGLGRYVTSSSFAVDVVENWQSEYLQFLLYIWATVWLLQRGSPESKDLESAGWQSDKEQKVLQHAAPNSPRWARVGGWRTAVFSRSLVLVMGAIFLGCWAVQSVAGWAAFNQEQLSQLRDPLGWAQYLASAEFWDRTLQNWQSELLAVGSMAVLSIFLRQRGSPESKPVGEPHESTGVSN